MRGVPLANFVRNMGGLTGRFVVDKTGLTGPYDLDLQWIPDPTLGPATPQAAQGDGASLFTAIQEQLGLKLVATRGPVEVLVLHSAERPTEDQACFGLSGVERNQNCVSCVTTTSVVDNGATVQEQRQLNDLTTRQMCEVSDEKRTSAAGRHCQS